jgi:hypothetical protein
MAKVKIQGSASGTGILTVVAPVTSTNRTITLPDATGTLLTEVADDAITLAKMASGTDGNIISYDASGDPVAIATGDDGQVLTSAGAGAPPAFEDAAGGNTPYFYAYSSADQSVSDYTNTKISCNTEAEDSGGNYDPSTNYRFTVPSGQGGKYFVTAGIKYVTSGEAIRQTFIFIYKNGSIYKDQDWTAGSESGSLNLKKKTNFISHIIDLAATDYIELWGSCDDDEDGSPSLRGFFLGYKIG